VFGLDSIDCQNFLFSVKSKSEPQLKVVGISDQVPSNIAKNILKWGYPKYELGQSCDALFIFTQSNKERFAAILNLITHPLVRQPLIVYHPVLGSTRQAQQAISLIGNTCTVRTIDLMKCVPCFLLQTANAPNLGDLQLINVHYNAVYGTASKKLQIISALSQLVCIATCFLGNVSQVHTFAKTGPSTDMDVFTINVVSTREVIGHLSLSFSPEEHYKSSHLQVCLFGSRGSSVSQYPLNTYTETQEHGKPRVTEMGACSLSDQILALIKDSLTQQKDHSTDIFVHIKNFIVVEAILRSKEAKRAIDCLDVKKDLFTM